MVFVLSEGCSKPHYVSARPNAVIIKRTRQPRPGYIWVDGNYYWRGGRYQYRNGYWAAPRRGRNWNNGYWVTTPRGYYWKQGGWR